MLLITFLLAIEQALCSCWQENQRTHRARLPSYRASAYLAGCLAGHDDDFNTLLQPLLVARPPGSPALAMARQHIVDHLQLLGWQVVLDTFTASTPLGQKTFTNIVATLHPDSPRRLVLAAHYDSKVCTSWDSNGNCRDPAPGFIGATDSAVPCALLLHLASSLTPLLRGAEGSVPELSLQLVFFDGEEAFISWSSSDSLYGSRHLAATWANTPFTVRSDIGHCQDGPAQELDRMDALLLLDLLGAPNPSFKRFHQYNSTLYNLAQQIEGRLWQSSCFLGPPMFTGTLSYNMIQDDHLPFYNLGLRKILHMIASPFPSVWHTLADDATALHLPTIKQLGRVLRVTVFSYLNGAPA